MRGLGSQSPGQLLESVEQSEDVLRRWVSPVPASSIHVHVHARMRPCTHAHTRTQHAVRKDHDAPIAAQFQRSLPLLFFRSTSSFSIPMRLMHSLAQLLGPRTTAQQASSPVPEVNRNFLLGRADPGRGASTLACPRPLETILYCEHYRPHCTGLPGKRIPARRNLQPGTGIRISKI